MSRWFRWYEGTCEDGKFRVIARNAGVTVRDVIALWTFVLEDASNANHRGICTRNEDFMAAVLDFEDGEAEKILTEMENASLVSVGHGAISVCNWGKRQFENDGKDHTNADRQRKFRENKRKNGHVTESNGAVTGSETETKRPDTERTEAETEKKTDSRRIAVATAAAFEEFWKVYPKRGDGDNPKKPAAKKFLALTLSGIDPVFIVESAKRYAANCDQRKDTGTRYVAQAVTWLNQARFDDYGATAQPETAKIVKPRHGEILGPEHGEKTGKIFIQAETPEWDAWYSYARSVGKPSPPRYFHEGWAFPSLWPPRSAQQIEAAE